MGNSADVLTRQPHWDHEQIPLFQIHDPLTVNTLLIVTQLCSNL